VSLVEQELLTLSVHLSSPQVFSRVRVTRSLVLYICFVDLCLSFCTFSFGYCVVRSPWIYGFWLPLWYLQTLLTAWLTVPFHTFHNYGWFGPINHWLTLPLYQARKVNGHDMCDRYNIMHMFQWFSECIWELFWRFTLFSFICGILLVNSTPFLDKEFSIHINARENRSYKYVRSVHLPL